MSTEIEHMKLTPELLESFQRKANAIGEKYEFEFLIDSTGIGDETVYVDFPRDDAIEMTVADLNNYFQGLEEISITPFRVSSERFTQMPITCTDSPIDQLTEQTEFQFISDDGYTVRVVHNPLLIGIGASHLGYYEKFFPPCTSYTAVEIAYDSADKKLSEKDEQKILKTYLFELSHILNSAISFSQIWDVDEQFINEEIEASKIHVTDLQDYSEGMDLFRKALQSSDVEIRFLYFYKIIEYHSPLAAKKMAYENMMRKLDSIRYTKTTNKDLSDIFSIAEQFRVSQTDRELAQTILKNAVDIIAVFPLLPDAIKTRVTKHLHVKVDQISYEVKEDLKQSLIQMISGIIYSTRNSIVHAKSNYRSDGNECKAEDLAQLNIFLKETCYGVINWHSRLPEHLKFNS